jgi:MFS family permease
MLAIAGGGDTMSDVFRNSIMQTITPDHMRGRVEGVGLTVWATGPALGNLEAGAVATLVSVPFSIVSGGVICVLGTGLIAWLVPSFRSYRSPIVGAEGAGEDASG